MKIDIKKYFKYTKREAIFMKRGYDDNTFDLNEFKKTISKLNKKALLKKKWYESLSSLTFDKKKKILEEIPHLISYLTPAEQELYFCKKNFAYLSENIQLKIISNNNEYINFASDTAIKNALDYDPYILSQLEKNNQKKYIDKNIWLLEFSSEDVQLQFFYENEKNLAYCSKIIQLSLIKTNPNNYINCSSDVKKELIDLHMLDYKKIKIETLNAYVLEKNNKLPYTDLIELREKISNSDRTDKEELIEHLSYLIINIKKIRFNDLLEGDIS